MRVLSACYALIEVVASRSAFDVRAKGAWASSAAVEHQVVTSSFAGSGGYAMLLRAATSVRAIDTPTTIIGLPQGAYEGTTTANVIDPFCRPLSASRSRSKPSAKVPANDGPIMP